MGSIVSYLLGSGHQDDDDDDNDGDDVTTIRSLLQQVAEVPPPQRQQEQWDAILQRIEAHPEEAALFCHSQESSRKQSQFQHIMCFLLGFLGACHSTYSFMRTILPIPLSHKFLPLQLTIPFPF